VEIQHCENPRVELEKHYYNAVHTKLLDLGLQPTLLGEELVESMIHTIERHKGHVIESSIDPHTRWNPLKSPAGQA
jgi:UDP-sulfoquinovose synthase